MRRDFSQALASNSVITKQIVHAAEVTMQKEKNKKEKEDKNKKDKEEDKNKRRIKI